MQQSHHLSTFLPILLPAEVHDEEQAVPILGSQTGTVRSDNTTYQLLYPIRSVSAFVVTLPGESAKITANIDSTLKRHSRVAISLYFGMSAGQTNTDPTSDPDRKTRRMRSNSL